MKDSLQAVSSLSGSTATSGRAVKPTNWEQYCMACRISSSLDPNWRKSVISFTPAASAMRRVVEPRKPCCAKTPAAAARISSLRFMTDDINGAEPEMQVVTYLHGRFHDFASESTGGQDL